MFDSYLTCVASYRHAQLACDAGGIERPQHNIQPEIATDENFPQLVW
jgi:hypothetical protein